MRWHNSAPQWPFAIDWDKESAQGLIGLWTMHGPGRHNYLYDLVGRRDFAFQATPPIWTPTDESSMPLALDYGTVLEAKSAQVASESYWDVQANTIAVWFKSRTAQHWSNMFGRPQASTHFNPFFDFAIGTVGNAPNGLWYRGTDNTNHTISSSNIYVNNTINHGVGCWDPGLDSGFMDIFINGAEASYTGHIADTNATVHASEDLYTGVNVIGNDEFDGLIMEIRLYNKKLSAETIARLYEPGTRWDTYFELGKTRYSFVPPAVSGGVPSGFGLLGVGA